jgi:hypothetical protein
MVGRIWRWIVRIVHRVGRVVRGSAEQAGIAQTMGEDGPGQRPSAIGGAMMVGAARRIGEATNEMPDDHDPERDWRDR